MSYHLSARANGDAPPPAIAHEEDELTEAQREGEADRGAADAAVLEPTPEPEDGFDGQVAQQDLDSADANADGEDVQLSQTPGVERDAAEQITTTEHAQGEQMYQERLPSNVATPPAITIWSESTVNDMRSRLQAVQLRFVDDPAAVAGEMQALVGEAVEALSVALTDRQRELDDWSRSGGHDTEQLRAAVQRYRDFYELLLGH
jgi:hypothetical protein